MTNWPALLLCGLLELKLKKQFLKRERNNNAMMQPDMSMKKVIKSQLSRIKI